MINMKLRIILSLVSLLHFGDCQTRKTAIKFISPEVVADLGKWFMLTLICILQLCIAIYNAP